jgi:ribose transport system ATP-binding protein
LNKVDFDLYAGEVHVLLGENGAGKSTLVKILSGSLQKDSGHVFVEGKEIDHLTPERAQKLGIAMVYQEFSLVPSLTVAENIFLGHLPRSTLGFVKWNEIHQKAAQIFATMGVEIDPRAKIRKLSVAQQQLSEIARILSKEPKLIVLDEPTSALSDTERETLFGIIRRLQAQGVGIIYISHHLEEVQQIGQRVTIMRDGQVIRTMLVEEATIDAVVRLMVGRQLDEHYPKAPAELGGTVLRVENLCADSALQDVSFELRRGEILGVFGLMGAGQEELAHVLFGLKVASGGTVTLEGKIVNLRHPINAIKQGLGFLPRDRRASLLPMQPIAPNITLANVSQGSFFHFLNLRKEAQTATKYISDLHIRPPILARPVVYFSGGNQQKVCLARWLCNEAKVLIVDEPTRGIDVGAKTEVYTILDELIQGGVGIVMISSEMPELLAMADRILVMHEGRITAEYQRGEATQEMLLKSAS